MTGHMTPLLAIHIAGGIVAVIGGYAALFARKGSVFHRYAGRGFVGSMLVMALGAMVLALRKGETGNALAAVFVTYLVVTAVTTLLPDSRGITRLNIALRILGLALALTFVAGGVARLTFATESEGGVPARTIAVASFINATVMLLAWWGDVRVSRRGAPRGPARVRPVLTLLAVLPLLLLLFYLWRYRDRRGRVVAAPPGGVGLPRGARVFPVTRPQE